MHEFDWDTKLKHLFVQIGNPLLEFDTDFNSRAEYIWSHGLISDSTFEMFTLVCNYSQIRREIENGTLTTVCSEVIREVSREVSRSINAYDILIDVCLSSISSQSQFLNKLVNFELTLVYNSFDSTTANIFWISVLTIYQILNFSKNQQN